MFEPPPLEPLLEESQANGDFVLTDREKNDDDFLGDSDEDDFVVTIGEIKANVPFKNQATGGSSGVKPDLDANPTIKGTQIYDLDLATMEDKPWRKPGSDITDYFNYDTWNQYCERQKKLRVEYNSNQEAINKAIFNSISLPVAPQLTTLTGGRQLVSILGNEKSAAKLMGGTSESSTPTFTSTQPTSNSNNPSMTMDFSKPPPSNFTQPPPSFDGPPPSLNISGSNLAEIASGKMDAPPGIETPPGFEPELGNSSGINIGVIGGLNTTLPPPG